MQYNVKTWPAESGDVVPLISVAQAMAVHAATGYGTLPLHTRTLVAIREERIYLLLAAATSGRLEVCDEQGCGASAKELINAGRMSDDSSAEGALLSLYARHHHLNVWAEASGDCFRFVDTPGEIVAVDLTDASGKVLEAGYYRGFIGGGETPFIGSGTAPWPKETRVAEEASTVGHGEAEPLVKCAGAEILGPAHPGGVNPTANERTSQQLPPETTDERCARLLREFQDEEKLGTRGALARVARRNGRKRQLVAADLARARQKASSAGTATPWGGLGKRGG